MTTSDTIERARDLHAQQAWGGVHALLSTPATAGELGFADLERLATADYMLGRSAETDDALERAYLAAVREANIAGAARSAFWLGFGLSYRGEMARAGGWMARAGRLLEDDPEPRVERGYLLLPGALGLLGEGDFPGALERFEAIGAIAEQFGSVDLATLSRLGRGDCLIGLNQRQRGIALLDEAMIAVTSGEVSPMIVGLAYCAAIESFQRIFDLRRAQEWTAALTTWCEAQPDTVPYRGRCLVYRAELMVLHGAWPKAADEAQRARDRLAGPPPEPALGEALYQQAELNRLRGAYAAAEILYREAAELGRRPEPGLALLRLAQGRPEIAAAVIRRALDEAVDPLVRPRLLGPCVEIMLGVGDIEAATGAAGELNRIGLDSGSPMLQAIASGCDGAVHLAAGDPRAALAGLRRSADLWRQLDAPYELARIRVLIGVACRRLGDEDTASIEFAAAAAVFRDLGAVPDRARLAGSPDAGRPDLMGLSPREIEVLRLIASGGTNRAIATELGISERTIDRHVSNIFTKLEISSRAAATAFAYEHDLV